MASPIEACSLIKAKQKHYKTTQKDEVATRRLCSRYSALKLQTKERTQFFEEKFIKRL